MKFKIPGLPARFFTGYVPGIFKRDLCVRMTPVSRFRAAEAFALLAPARNVKYTRVYVRGLCRHLVRTRKVAVALRENQPDRRLLSRLSAPSRTWRYRVGANANRPEIPLVDQTKTVPTKQAWVPHALEAWVIKVAQLASRLLLDRRHVASVINCNIFRRL